MADSESSTILGGFTYSDDFPVVDPFQGSRGGSMDAFLSKIEHEVAPPQMWEATVTYTYDPLYRLREANYSTGEYYWYTYDAVGNRLTQTTHEDSNVYVYDDANKLIEVDGVTYTWDVNGNLLSDGVSTYTYDRSNRLVSVVQGDDEYEFEYSGLGDRLSQSVNGEWTDYTLDLASGLTQVLADGTNGYLYGIGRLGEEQTDGWQYHLGDALGSVRLLTDSSSDVARANSYKPFGEMLMNAGATKSLYGFVGEWKDATGLTYLRARYYSPSQSRFISLDPSRMESNLYIYANANPINVIDPSGLIGYTMTGMEVFALCFDIHTGSQGLLSAAYLPQTYISAQDAVDICRAAYSKDPWDTFKGSFNLREAKPSTAHELFGMFLYETGDRNLIFNGYEPLTRELSVSSMLMKVRTNFYTMGETTKYEFFRFNSISYFTTLIADLSLKKPLSLPLSNVLGSFYYQTKIIEGSRVGFRIDNDMTLESGTHIRGRWSDEGYTESVEGLIEDNFLLGLMPVQLVFATSPVISILESRTREETTGQLGGGSMIQTFVWTEKIDACNWHFMWAMNDPELLDVQPWSDYKGFTEDPLEDTPR